jgi:hypothetical protein
MTNETDDGADEDDNMEFGKSFKSSANRDAFAKLVDPRLLG